MELGLLLVAALGWALLVGFQLRRDRVVRVVADVTDGVPRLPMEDSDGVGHSVFDGAVVIRQMSSRPTTHGGRFARGSVAPPFARVAAGEFVVATLLTRARTPLPTRSVDDGWDDIAVEDQN